MRYMVNKGVGAPLEVLGLKGSYILIGIGSIVFLIILSAILFNTSVPFTIVLICIIVLSTALIGGIIQLNKKFGLYGLMKLLTGIRLPFYIRNKNRIESLINKINSKK